MENSERLGRQARLGIKPGTSLLLTLNYLEEARLEPCWPLPRDSHSAGFLKLYFYVQTHTPRERNGLKEQNMFC